MDEPGPGQDVPQEPRLSGDPLAGAGTATESGTTGRRAWRIDTTPLRTSRDFRLLWTSGLVTFLGSMVTYVAIPFQLKELTGSLTLAGLLGLVEVVPLVVFGLYGGALADAVDRRRMVLTGEAAMLVLSGTLFGNALLDEPQVWVLFVVSALFAVFDALQRPSLDAMIPRVVAHDELVAASALSSLRYSGGTILGPVLGGLLVTAVGSWSAYAFDVVTFCLSLLLLLRVGAVPPPEDADRPSLAGVAAGLRYAWSRKELLGTYAVDTAAMVFGMVTALFPFVADRLDAPWALGLLYSAGSLGALLATLTSGWAGRVHRHGRAIALAAAAYGAFIALFGLAGTIWVALGFLTLAGGADMVSGIFRSAVWNQTIPDELRGRLAGIELLSYSLGPTFGNARAGLVAARTSQRASIVSGGVLCVLSVSLLAMSLPSLWRYDERTNEHAVRERARRAQRARPTEG